jgi:uncharacterized protein (TIGR03083 family)
VPADTLIELIPEWTWFLEAVISHRPEHGTACEAWTVRDVVAHNAGNAQELARVLRAHLEGRRPPPTRALAERELPFRNLANADLLDALEREMGGLAEVLADASGADLEQLVPWTGRKMKVAWFGEHMREELILHRWDITGDDEVGTRLLNQPWLTEHSVVAVGKPLLRRGIARLGKTRRVSARLRCDGRYDVIIVAGSDSAVIELGPPEGAATIETDPAARVLLLWGRRPADPARVMSSAGPAALGDVRRLLSGC